MRYLLLIITVCLLVSCDKSDGDDIQPVICPEPLLKNQQFVTEQATFSAIEGKWRYVRCVLIEWDDLIDSIGYHQDYDYTNLKNTVLEFKKDPESKYYLFEIVTDINLGGSKKKDKFRIFQKDESEPDSPYIAIKCKSALRIWMGKVFYSTADLIIRELTEDTLELWDSRSGNERGVVLKRIK